MAHDDDFIIGGRKNRKSSSQGTPKTNSSKGGGGMSFTKRLAKDMAIAGIVRLTDDFEFSIIKCV
ncbi:MAG: hypothetical protein ABJG88_08920 [Litorimonas sp.]